jgi:hypothetical protein
LRVRPHDLTVLLPDPPSPADVVESLSRLMAGLRHPVPVTQKGTVYRRALVQLLDLVGPAPVPAGPEWSQTFAPILKHLRHPVSWQGYDDRLAPFLAVLAALGLLVVDPDGRTVKTCEDASAFAAGEPWSLYRVIVHTWLRLLKSFPGTSAVRARALPADTWVPLEALALERPAHSFAEREGLFLLAVTGYHLGALRFAMGPEENVFVQLTEGAAHALLQTDGDPPPGWPAFSRTVHVQSSFEIVTPPYLHPATWFDLLFLTEPVRIDRSSILRLTEASFARHRDHDLSPRDAVEILTRSIRGPLPQAVSFTLSNWAEKMKGVGLSQRLVVRLDDESLAERFRSLMEQGHVAFERVTPTLWLVPPGSHVWVQDRLTAAGMITRDETVSPSESIDSFRVLFEGRAPELPRWFALPWPGPTHPIARQLWTPTPEPTLGNDWGKGDDEPDDF